MIHLHKVGQRILVSGVPWIRVDMELQKAAQAAASAKPGLFDRFSRRKKSAILSNADKEKILVKTHGAALVAGSVDMPVMGFLSRADLKAFGKTPLFGKLYALAEVFCSLPNLPICAILAVPLDDDPDQFAMCVAINGTPAPDPRFDVIVSRDQVADRINTWTFELSSQYGSTPVIYGEWPDAVPMTLSRLIEDSHGYRALRKSGSDPRVVSTMVGVAVLIVAAGVGQNMYEKQKAAKIARLNKQKNDPILQYNNALNQQWAQLKWGSARRTQAVIAATQSIPLNMGGFDLSGDIACDIETASCKLIYKRGSGTFLTFRDAAKGMFTPTSYGQDGRTVEVSMALSNVAPAEMPPQWEQFPSEDALPLLFWSEIQQLPEKYVEATMLPQYQMFPSIPGINESSLPKVVRFVPINITVPMWAAYEMPLTSGIFSSAISWKKITVSPHISGVSKLTLAGEMYATKGN